MSSLKRKRSGNQQKVIRNAHSDAISALEFTHGGDVLISGGSQGDIKLWDASTMDMIGYVQTTSHEEIYSISASPTKDEFVVCFADATIHKYGGGGETDVVLEWQITNAHAIFNGEEETSVITDVVYSPSGTMFVSCGYDGRIILWDSVSGGFIKLVYFIEDASPELQKMCWTKDGRFIIAQTDDAIYSIKTHDWTLSTRHYVHSGTIATDPTNSKIIKYSTIDSLYEFHHQTGRRRRILSNCDGWIRAIASSDQVDVYADNDDDILNVVDNEGCIHTYLHHTSTIVAVAVSPAKYIASGDMSGCICINI